MLTDGHTVEVLAFESAVLFEFDTMWGSLSSLCFTSLSLGIWIRSCPSTLLQEPSAPSFSDREV